MATVGPQIPFLKYNGAVELALMSAFFWGACFLGIAVCRTTQWLGGMTIRPPAQWICQGEFSHEGPIPEEARQLIAQAKLFKPAAAVNIHTLMQRDRVLDPILEIDGVYCLVWDEHGKIILPPA